jgi:pimeloyl-ACP methyl ester carboxylesterase
MPPVNETIQVESAGARTRLSCFHRNGERSTVVCLHGFGSTKEDYTDLALHSAFAGRDLVFWDAPGCGQSICDKPELVSIPLLVDVVDQALSKMQIQRCHLVGHSMGGLTALQFATANPDRVLSFTNIEGNLAPEDCFLSRQIFDHPAETPQDFLNAFAARVREKPEWSNRLYVANLPVKVHPDAVAPIFRSMVELSDHAPLLEAFIDAPFPKMFVYGEQNSEFSYIERLTKSGIEVAEIPSSAHFPMYSNPQELWSRLAQFIDRCDQNDMDARQ